MGKGQPKQRMSASERKSLKTVNLAKGTLKWQTTRKQKRPVSKGAPAMRRADQKGLEDQKEKEAKHPFLRKGKPSSKLLARAPTKCAKPEAKSESKRRG